jgi:hypothetical protein
VSVALWVKPAGVPCAPVRPGVYSPLCARCWLAQHTLLLRAGDVEALLGTYDRERRVLPMPMAQWSWGWTQSAETWNGRIAMLAIVVVLILEVRRGALMVYGCPADCGDEYHLYASLCHMNL